MANHADSGACAEFRAALPNLDDGQPVDHALVLHVDGCLRCQAEAAKHRRLLRAMRALRTRYLEPSPDALAQVLAGLGEASERKVVRNMLTGKRIAYAGAIGGAAAVAAGGAAAVAIVARSRRRGGPGAS